MRKALLPRVYFPRLESLCVGVGVVRVLGFKVNVFPAWSANPCCSLSWVLLVQGEDRTEIEGKPLDPFIAVTFSGQ